MSCDNYPAPIALFVYSRPRHTRETIEALQRNRLASDSDLVIFSDAAKSADKVSAVNEVRDYIRSVSGFRSVTVVVREENLGLSRSIIDGVTRLCSEHGQVVVLEDDMVTSPHFLSYMNDGLECYADEARVASIHGYIYPVAAPLPETFFIRGADCWGWATWQRAWRYFNPDGQYLLDELMRSNLTSEFDFNNSYPYTQMLRAQITGRNDSWAIRWYASAFMQEMVTLYPGESLIQNIGTDGSGSHCGVTSALGVVLKDREIKVEKLPVSENRAAKRAVEGYFNSVNMPSSLRVKQRFLDRMKSLFAK